MGLTNEEMDEYISAAMEKLEKSGINSEIISVEEAEGEETTYLEVTEGAFLNQGEVRPLFRIEGNKRILLEKPKILLSTGKFSHIEALILSVREKLPKRKPLLAVFAEPGDSHIAVQEKTDETYIFQTLSSDGIVLLEDIATLAGGKILQEGHAALSDLGEAGFSFISEEDGLVIQEGRGSAEDIAKRVHEIKAEVEKAIYPIEEMFLLNRLQRVVGGTAVIKVGGKTKGEKEAGVKDFKRRLTEWGTEGGGQAATRPMSEPAGARPVFFSTVAGEPLSKAGIWTILVYVCAALMTLAILLAVIYPILFL